MVRASNILREIYWLKPVMKFLLQNLQFITIVVFDVAEW